MDSEAEAKAEAKAKVILSNAEGLASQRLVSAGDDLSPVTIHLRYLQTMLKIHRPVEDDMAHIVPMPLEIVRYWVGRKRFNNFAEKIKDKLRAVKLKRRESAEINLNRRRNTKYSLVKIKKC